MRRFRLRFLWLAALMLAADAPASAQTTIACPRGLKALTIAELVFGRNIGEVTAGVSEEEWVRFLDEVVTPRFPTGLTVIDTYGQWWDAPAGRVEREPSKMLLVILSDEAGQRGRLGEIASEYKRRFSQKSVIVMMRRACVTF